jgi:hypothetical protein
LIYSFISINFFGIFSAFILKGRSHHLNVLYIKLSASFLIISFSTNISFHTLLYFRTLKENIGS